MRNRDRYTTMISVRGVAVAWRDVLKKCISPAVFPDRGIVINLISCNGCGECVKVCDYGAIRMNKIEEERQC